MLGRRVIIDRRLGNKVLGFLKNPIVGLFIGTALSLFLYWIAIAHKTPYYYVTKPVRMDSHVGGKQLTLTFRGQPVKDLYFIDLVLWNNGEQFVDYTDFIYSKPITVYGGNGIQMLFADIVVQSREDLRFESNVVNNQLLVRLMEDEALENRDGVMFRVYYSIKDGATPNFAISSRVKGTNDGFTFKDLKSNLKIEHTHRVLIGWVAIISVILIRIIWLSIARKPLVFRVGEVIVFTLLMIIWSWYTYEYIYYAVDLDWIVGFI